MDPVETVKEASRALQNGELDRCESLCRQRIAQTGDDPACLQLLGLVALQRGHPGQAIRWLTEAIHSDPEKAEYHNNLGTALRHAGRLHEALEAFHQAIKLQDDFDGAYSNLGLALDALNRLTEAEAAFRAALQRTPEDGRYLNNLAICLQRQGRIQEAASCMQRCLAAGQQPAPYYNYSLLLKRMGDLAGARKAARAAVRQTPDDGRAWMLLTQLNTVTDPGHPDLLHIQALSREAEPGSEQSMLLHYALGKALHDCGDTAQALAHYQQANHYMAACYRHDPQRYTQQVENIRASVTRELILSQQLPAHSGPQPIFIIGLSRSGKTLLERHLQCHPHVHGGGELCALPDLALPGLLTDRPYPRCLNAATRETLLAARERYLDFLHTLAPQAAYVTDTLPANVLHLGLIAMLFPNAPVIHMKRDPDDTRLAIYFKWFGSGHHYAYDLTHIRQRQADHAALMAHWHAVLPRSPLELRYEDLIASPAATIERAATACGLPVSDDLHRQWRASGLHSQDIGLWKRYHRLLENPASAPGVAPLV